ncbi:hypothetical protein MKZ25_00095 [Solibacillus sp. FSL W7-1464]
MPMMKSGKLPVDQLLSNSILFDEINEGFDLLATGDNPQLL